MENPPGEHKPWSDAEARYQPGQQVQGTVTRVTHLGVFVRVEPGLEGIIYAFELGAGPAAAASFVPGQELQLYVRSIDVGRRRLELSLHKQSTPGLLEEHVVPSALRRSKSPEAQSWPLPLPGAPAASPFPLPDMPSEPSERSCPTCQRSVQAAWKYCVYCGGSLRRHCSACGSVQPDLPDARYCCECGRIVS